MTDEDRNGDRRVLARFWHPVARAEDVPADRPLAAELLGRKLVVYRVGAALVVAEDRCPHRGTRLSLGRVAGERLLCGYHGLGFDVDGRGPGGMRLAVLASAVRHGLVWASLVSDPEGTVPDFPEAAVPGFRILHLRPILWAASPIRQIESVIDLTHFPVVHGGEGRSRLGGEPSVPDYEVRAEAERIVIDFTAGGATAPGFWSRRYEITLPFTVRLCVRRTARGSWCLFNSVCPLADDRSLIFVVQAFNFNHDAIAAHMERYEEQVYEEDRAIVESQTPVRPSLAFNGEQAMEHDRAALLYRRALRALGLPR